MQFIDWTRHFQLYNDLIKVENALQSHCRFNYGGKHLNLSWLVQIKMLHSMIVHMWEIKRTNNIIILTEIQSQVIHFQEIYKYMY